MQPVPFPLPLAARERERGTGKNTHDTLTPPLSPDRNRTHSQHKQHINAKKLLYCLMGGKFPFNAFLASFLGHVSFFALTLALRQQLDPATCASEFPGLAPERAVADYVLANLVVLLAVWNYLG